MIRRLAVGWASSWLVLVGLALHQSFASESPRVVFGEPARLPTADALERPGWVELTDAFFDCDAWEPGSGRVPVRHPDPDPEVWFDRESACHGHRADRVEGWLEAGPDGSHVVRSLAPIDDPLVLWGLAAGFGLLIAAMPLVWLQARDPTRPPRRPLAELTVGVGPRMHPAFWANELPGLAAWALFAVMGLVGVALAVSWAWDIAVDEPRTWATGEPREPVQLDDREGIFVTWMEGTRPSGTNLSLSLFVRLEDDFVGDPEVRVGPDGEVATNVGFHYANTRLLFVAEWFALCLLVAGPGCIFVTVASARAVRWVRAARHGRRPSVSTLRSPS